MPPRNKIESASVATPRRQSTRTKVPVMKNPYFEHPSEDGEESDTASNFEEGSEPDDDDDDAVPGDEVEAREEEDEGEEEIPAKPAKKRGRTSSTTATAQPRDVKKKKASSGEVFIPHKRAPSPGDIDYTGNQIHPNTLRFLSGD